MRRAAIILLCAAVLAALPVCAQTTNATNAPGAGLGPALAAPAPDQQRKSRLPSLGPPRSAPPGAVTYGGALAAAARADKPLHLLNPFAPPEYGDGAQFVRRDLYTGQAKGVSLFSIHFDFRPKASTRKPAGGDAEAKPKQKKAKPAAESREK